MSKRKHAIEAYFQNGVRLHGSGRLQEAEQVYRQILAASPGHADSLHMLGVIALQCGQPQGALSCIDQAIALRPDAPLFHVHRAAALLALQQHEEALAACRTALRIKPNCAEAHQVLGDALSDLGRPDEAIAAYRDALRQRPDLPGLYNNLGLALRQADRPEEAVAAFQQAVKRAPQDTAARGNLAGMLKEMARLADSEAQCREALRLQPGDPMLHLNLGVVLLLAGRFEEGWKEYEWRFRAGAVRVPACSQPLWAGEALDGRTLLVRAEQGLGDTLQFCRYLPLVAKRGRVIFETQPGLKRLLRDVLTDMPAVNVGDALPRFDCYCPLLSLPRLLGMAAPLPPYLSAEPGLVAEWRQRIGMAGRKIGIAWQGNPTAAAERGRSIPLHEFLPLARVPGVRLISLQKHHGVEQLAAAPAELRVETLGEAFDSGEDAFVDTAAAMQCLDLIITSDTSIAHLAGALGRPVWVGLKHVPDWRWQLEGDECRWYPSMRLFRQTSPGDWSGVMTRMTERLAIE